MIGSLLLVLVLPGPLNTPNHGTQELAEYTPTPPQGPAAEAANFAPVGTPTSVGLGSSILAAPPDAPPQPALPEFAPRQKECFGIPPRQTEDPISPPCVPFFDGSNGGATAQGVTKDQIDIIVYVEDLHEEVDLNKPWKPTDEYHDPSNPLFTPNLVRSLKSLLAYFNLRYQTYGRTVRARAIPAFSGEEEPGSNPCGRRRNEAMEVARRQPFAVVNVGYWGARCFRQHLATYGIPYFGTNYDVSEREYEKAAPAQWGFFPDQETTAVLNASFMCRSLADQPARFAGPEQRTSERRFAILYPEHVDDGSDLYTVAHRQVAEKTFRAMTNQCDAPVELVRYIDDQIPTEATRLRQRGVTTILCRCPNEHVTYWTGMASSIGWHPEWIFDQPMAVAFYGRILADQSQTALGISPRWRHPAFREQFHYQAFLRMSPGATPNPILNSDIYYAFHTLFTAIQVAGPILTTTAMQHGMQTLRMVEPGNPWIPSGGWGPYAPSIATGSYAFIDSAMAWWYDPAGEPPGGTRADGCLRVALGGTRFFADGWPTDDSYLMTDDAPCTGSDIEGVDDQ